MEKEIQRFASFIIEEFKKSKPKKPYQGIP